jgi:hypothetical protein
MSEEDSAAANIVYTAVDYYEGKSELAQDGQEGI